MSGDRGGWRWLLLPLVLAAALAVSYASYRLAGWSWDQVVSYRSPYVSGDLPQAKAGAPAAGRLVLVIVDGLRGDAARDMDSMRRLREKGADLTLVAAQPSLSFPTWTTILSGAEQDVTGVTTNWFEERVPVETLLETALSSGKKVAVIAPTSFETLYGARRAQDVALIDWTGDFIGARLVDEALRIEAESHPDLMIVHLPDVDEAGHDSGGTSEEYRKAVARTDGDLVRLVEGTQDPSTAYAIVADHGHIDSGGHGGWEDIVVNTPAVIAGDGVKYAKLRAAQADLAPTLAVLLGVPVPRHATGGPIEDVFASPDPTAIEGALRQRATFATHYQSVVGASGGGLQLPPPDVRTADDEAIESGVRQTVETREARERILRLQTGLPVAVAALLVIGLVGIASRRALIASLAGALAYYAVYNAAYFLGHGYRWSLSAFNSETKIQAFFNMRMVEAVAAGIVAAAVAGLVYGLLRAAPYPPRGRFLPGWLVLGPSTVLVIQATLALQAAWFLWWWGATVTWRMPDFMWAFKYDLDLIQTTALAGAAVLSPLVTFLIGRYHPRVRRAEEGRRGDNQQPQE